MGDPERPDRLRPLPGRLQHQRDDARGQGRSGSSRATTPRSTRAGSATRAASRSRHLDAGDRIARPAPQGRAAALRGARLGRRRSTRPSGCCAPRGAATVTALSGARDRRAGLRARQAAARGARRHTAPCCPRRSPTGSTRSARRSPRLRDASTIVVLCDEPVVERAPVVDLWIKAARRNGATILTELPDEPADRRVLVTDDAAGRVARGDLDAEAVFYLPRTPNGRGVADAWSAPATASRTTREPQLLVISGDEAAADPGVRALAERARRRDRDRDVRGRRSAASPTSSCPARATSSATARPSTSRAASSASAAP